MANDNFAKFCNPHIYNFDVFCLAKPFKYIIVNYIIYLYS